MPTGSKKFQTHRVPWRSKVQNLTATAHRAYPAWFVTTFQSALKCLWPNGLRQRLVEFHRRNLRTQDTNQIFRKERFVNSIQNLNIQVELKIATDDNDHLGLSLVSVTWSCEGNIYYNYNSGLHLPQSYLRQPSVKRVLEVQACLQNFSIHNRQNLRPKHSGHTCRGID